jgi:hypothetical protein
VYGSRPPPPRAAGTAKVLIIVGLILQAIEVVVFTLLALGLAVFLIGIIFLPFAIIGIIWIVLVYLFSYRRVSDGDYEGARTPTLVFAILSLITFNLISGVLYIIGYVEIGTAIQQQATAQAQGAYGTAPNWGAAPGAPTLPPPPMTGASRVCSHCGRVNPATAQFCAGCGAPMT